MKILLGLSVTNPTGIQTECKLLMELKIKVENHFDMC